MVATSFRATRGRTRRDAAALRALRNWKRQLNSDSRRMLFSRGTRTQPAIVASCSINCRGNPWAENATQLLSQCRGGRRVRHRRIRQRCHGAGSRRGGISQANLRGGCTRCSTRTLRTQVSVHAAAVRRPMDLANRVAALRPWLAPAAPTSDARGSLLGCRAALALCGVMRHLHLSCRRLTPPSGLRRHYAASGVAVWHACAGDSAPGKVSRH